MESRCSADAKPHIRCLPPSRRAAIARTGSRLVMDGGSIEESSQAQTVASHKHINTTLHIPSAESMRLLASWQAHKYRALTSTAR